MSLISPTLESRIVRHGIALIALLLTAISIVIGIEPSGPDELALAASTSSLPSPVPSGVPSPVSPLPTPAQSPSPPTSPSPPPSQSASPTGTPSPTPRNLANYENGGTLTVGFEVAGSAREQVLEQLRGFILRKWNARQPGRLAFVSYSPRNQALIRRFYVESGAGGVWQVAIEMQDTDPKIYRFVEEIGVAANGHPILEPNRPGSPTAVTRALHLKQHAGIKTGLIF